MILFYELFQKDCRRCGSTFLGVRWRRDCTSCSPPGGKVDRTPAPTNCEICNASLAGRKGAPKYCVDCAPQAYVLNRRNRPKNTDNDTSRKVTKYAVKVGFLPPPTEFDCQDCGRVKAECYDHRDYNKPLDVDPVCLRCNSSRGRGIPLKSPHLDIESVA